MTVHVYHCEAVPGVGLRDALTGLLYPEELHRAVRAGRHSGCSQSGTPALRTRGMSGSASPPAAIAFCNAATCHCADRIAASLSRMPPRRSAGLSRASAGTVGGSGRAGPAARLAGGKPASAPPPRPLARALGEFGAYSPSSGAIAESARAASTRKGTSPDDVIGAEMLRRAGSLGRREAETEASARSCASGGVGARGGLVGFAGPKIAGGAGRARGGAAGHCWPASGGGAGARIARCVSMPPRARARAGRRVLSMSGAWCR